MHFKQSYYAVIPANVRYSKSISNGAKLLYAEITCLVNETGFCWATNSYFGDLYGKSVDTISRWIAELANAGFILTLVDNESGNSRKIWLSETQGIRKNADRVSAKMQRGYPQKSVDPIRKNAEQNNKVNNKMNNNNDDEEKPTHIVTVFEPAAVEEITIPGIGREALNYVDNTQELDGLKEDFRVKELFSMSRKIPAEKFEDYVKAFGLEIAGRDKKYFNRPAFRDHFFSFSSARWRSEINSKPSQTNRSQPVKRGGPNHFGGDPSKYLEKQAF